jgi:uncharacterized protein YjiS (DUF1127 family)
MTVAAHPPLRVCQAADYPSNADRVAPIELFGRLIRRWRSRTRARRAFESFGYRDLRDIGVSRWDVERELANPFWRG